MNSIDAYKMKIVDLLIDFNISLSYRRNEQYLA